MTCITEERQVEVKMFLFRAGSRIGEHSFVQAVARQTLVLFAQLPDLSHPFPVDVGSVS